MRTKKNIKRFGKKAFISDSIVDIWAIILFVVVVILFAILFNFKRTEVEEKLQVERDVIYGNYLAQVYLRKPVTVGDQQMTVAELIALYDYNQSMQIKEQGGQLDVVSQGGIFAKWLKSDDGMRDAIKEITWNFVDDNFKDPKRYNCYVFSIKGNGFEFSKFGMGCGTSNAFSIDAIINEIGVPRGAYLTYLPSVDPRQDPIKIYSIYDLDSLILTYGGTEVRDIQEAQKRSIVRACARTADPAACTKRILETE